jgi:rfaE bifunctional protein nucleotidyltransferase chain/domain
MRLENTALKIHKTDTISAQVKKWQANKEKVVFTNGCFDILHLGHVRYLEKAAQLGDRLVVGVNTDASVKKLKGETRPINNENARCALLAALAFTDAIVLFEEETPLELITLTQPDVLVKGSDYTPDKIVGADVVLAKGGEVKTIDFVAGYSTTSIIDKMKK